MKVFPEPNIDIYVLLTFVRKTEYEGVAYPP
jgi:hypothetical protein